MVGVSIFARITLAAISVFVMMDTYLEQINTVVKVKAKAMQLRILVCKMYYYIVFIYIILLL